MAVRALLLALPCLFSCAAPPAATPAPLAVLYLLDKSATMPEFDRLKKGCAAGPATLQPSDYVGVLAFDTFPRWVVRFTHPGEAGKLEALGRIQAEGGSELHHALREAARAFGSLPADPPLRKRLILISEGNTERTGLEKIVHRLVKEGVTVSTISISSEQSNPALMSELAAWGRGRCYFTNKPPHVAKLLAEETRQP
jgi:Mg-chelatase subunit ChlD